jgi:alpha-glucosidase
VFTWDKSRFPDPAGLLGDLRNSGFETVAILDPGVKVDQQYATFRDGTAHDVFLRDASGKPVRREVWPGTCQFPDFTDPGSRRWWSGQVARFAAVGFAGLWNDMNEPSTFDDPSRSLPDTVHHDWEGEGISHVRGGHAVYGMQMARATREGLAAARPEQRPFVLTRAGYAGVQRYAATWTGDSRSSWEHLRMTIPQLCNLAISGISFSGSDAGGFRGEPGAELYLRWMQLASMTPFFRTHSARTSSERNPWSYGEPTTARIRSVIERRYRLLPYLYTQMHRAAAVGTPVMRPMFFEQPNEKDYSRIDDQFMLGDSLLVAPILEPGGRARIVRLPPRTWYEFDTGRPRAGSRSVVVEAGWDLPIFVRAGAVVPLWPVRQSTATPVGSLILDIYAGSAGSALYEDAGDGFGYRTGDFLLSTFTTVLGRSGLEVSWRTEGKYVRPSQQVEVRVLGLGTVPREVLRDGSPVEFRVESGAVVLEGGAFQKLTVST